LQRKKPKPLMVRLVRRGKTVPPTRSPSEDVILEDHRGEIAALYRPGDAEVVLLRPDGHIGGVPLDPMRSG
jgi:hypothetical protein